MRLVITKDKRNRLILECDGQKPIYFISAFAYLEFMDVQFGVSNEDAWVYLCMAETMGFCEIEIVEVKVA